MITENSSKELRLAFFKALYDGAKNAYSDKTDAYERNMRQYKGSLEIDGSSENASTVRNITYEIIESQISCDIPLPKVDAMCYSERRARNAVSIERLLSSIRDKLPFELMNDYDERYTYIYGGSVWYVEWDNSKRLGKEVGGVSLYCLSPDCFIPQPAVASVEDMEYCFLKISCSLGEISRKYGVPTEKISLAELDYSESDVIGENDIANVIVCFYRDEEGEIGKFVFSGDLTLSDLPAFYRRKELFCKTCKQSEAICRCKKPRLESKDVIFEELDEKIRLSDGGVISHLSPVIENGNLCYDAKGVKMQKSKIPYYTPKSFPIVIRKNPSPENSVIGQSDCEYIRPEQQAINKLESRILQKLLRAQITPIMPEDATLSPSNSIFGQIIKMKPGESVAQYGKVDTTPNISQDIVEAERLYEHSKRILGISDALQGMENSSAESGYARQLKISQATGRLESKRKLKYTAYAELDRRIFEQYLAFADESRTLVYKDAYGRIHNAEFNRYDFIDYDEITGEYFYDDGYLFSVDLNGGAEYQREALWQRNLENLKAGTLGNPESNVTLLRYWQSQERAHYPHARENVEYFTLALEREKGDYIEAH